MAALEELVLRFSDHRSETLDEFFDAVHEARIVRGLEQDPAEFLRKLRPGPDGNLVASALLRLMAGHPEVIERSSLKHDVANFLDSNYYATLMPYYERPKNQSTFEVLNRLRQVAPAVEERLENVGSSLTTLDDIERCRNSIMKLVNSDAGRVILRPFIPSELLDGLTRVWHLALELRDAAPGNDMGAAYRKLVGECERVEASATATATEYSQVVVLASVRGARAAADRRVQLQSPNAALAFAVSERPLPLMEPGVTCSAVISVTNTGEAPATDVRLTTRSQDPRFIVSEEARLDHIGPKTRQSVAVSITVLEPIGEAHLTIDATWTNLDHSIGKSSGTVTVSAQDVDIRWEDLEGREPFSAYPVERPEELVGRGQQLAELRNAFVSQPMANLYVTGQRRVGKTSLVRVFLADLGEAAPSVCVANVELGEARAGEGAATIGALGRKLAERLLSAANLRDEIEVPMFTESLAPLTDVVESIRDRNSDLSFLLVIDEFDELPQDTYRRDGPGDALFVPMRSLAQKPYVGWLLVGGERMPFIRDEQAARLNTFRAVSLDYLGLHESGTTGRDFADLVRRPLPPSFGVDEPAVRAVYDASAGNPHFAKEICAAAFRTAVSRRDAVVSSAEINLAVERAAHERDVELFAHFWEDGIFEVGDERRRTELMRRDYLAAVAETLRTTGSLATERVRQAAAQRGLDSRSSDRMQGEFVRRQVLDEADGALQVHVPLFRQWLEEEGIYKLPLRGVADQVARTLAEQEQELAITDHEIRRLVQRWKGFSYRGHKMSRDSIEEWLDQFETPTDRRIAFRLLERMVLLSESDIFEGMRRLQRLVAQPGRVELRKGQRALTHIAVSAIGPTGASGEAFAYRYRQANNISGNNGVAIEALVDFLQRRTEVKRVVLVDDFIGSGGTAIKALTPLAERVSEAGFKRPLHWFVFGITGLETGIAKVQTSPAGQELGVRVEVASPILETALPFGSRSTVFSAEERANAERIIRRYGEQLAPKIPLGYGGSAALVSFSENCPNNAPPIFWSDAGGWKPLFSRTGQ